MLKQYKFRYIFIGILFLSFSFAKELTLKDIDKYIKYIDISHSYYKKMFYGKPKINIFKALDGSKLLVFEASYGGDGEHTGNIMKLFKLQGEKSVKLMEKEVDDTKFIENKGVLKAIRAEYMISLCDGCDGPDASAPWDIFMIPIKIDINTLKVVVELTQKQKKELLSKFENQSQKNIKEQLSYGRTTYPNYIAYLKKEILNMFNMKE